MDGDGPLQEPDIARPASIAINSHQVAYTSDDGVVVASLNGSTSQRVLRHGSKSLHVRPAIALSPLRPDDLAVSCRDRIYLYSIRLGLSAQTLHSNGRVITSVAWSTTDSRTLAIGAIDGSICIWDLTNTPRVRQQLVHSVGICSLLAFSLFRSDLLVSAHHSTIAIWSLSRPRRPVQSIYAGCTSVTALAWHPSLSTRLLTVSADNLVRVWEMPEVSAANKALSTYEDSSSDEEIFGGLDGVRTRTTPIAQLDLSAPNATAEWVGEHGMYVLLPDLHEIRVYSFGAEWETLHQVWRTTLELRAEKVVLRDVEGTVSLTAVARGRSETLSIPPAILDAVGGHVPQALSRLPASGNQNAAAGQRVTSMSGDTTIKWPPIMQAVPISQLRSKQSSFAKPSTQLQQGRKIPWQAKTTPMQRPRRESSNQSRQTTFVAKDQAPASPATPVTKALISSLELPKTRNGSDDSPMPFLSPSIPARNISPNTYPTIDDALDLSPLLRSTSVDSVALTSTNQDSESDDDTYHGALIGSATFMPGGVNVPLPKACGALFAPNGQLLTFFPPKMRQAAASEVQASEVSQAADRTRARKVAKLFPSFGDLTAGDDDSDDGVSISDDSSREYQEGGLPSFALHPSSFHSPPSWQERVSPIKPTFQIQDPRRIVVCVHDVVHLNTTERTTATAYRTLCEDGESRSELCMHNACVADEAGLADVRDIWKLIALVLEDRVPLQSATGKTLDVLIVARQVTSGLHSHGGIGLHTGASHDAGGKLCRANSPTGGAWLIRRCMEWAERLANVHLLALISAVLANHQQARDAYQGVAELSTLSRWPTHGHEYGLNPPRQEARAPRARPIPIFRNDSMPDSIVYESPTKSRQLSRTSSAQASQPSTPHLDLASTTPPLPLPAFSRQSTKLSSSGDSISPEHHRSSFSAAARHYANSITERFASYGTSPPLKKMGTSPNMGELSLSFPIAPGSWSKSVSFASTTSTTRESQLSKSYTTDEVDAYDSDKTIEDSSLPHTPKSGNSPVAVRLPNADMFADDVSGGAEEPLLSAELAADSKIWCSYYAEQLRCWGLWVQAAEMEKAIRPSQPDLVASSPHEGIVPVKRPGHRKATCNICYAVIVTLEQLCPICLHTTHLECLAGYLSSLEGDEAFECPSGCGCTCDRLPLQPIELSPLQKVEASPPAMIIRKKPSYTDPRRWRARIEGGSW